MLSACAFEKSLGNPVETPGSIEASDADDMQYDAETGEFKYTIKVTISKLAVASGSGSAKVSTALLDA